MMDWLHALDVGMYRLVSHVWFLYWPILAVVLLLCMVERLFGTSPKAPFSSLRFNLVWHGLQLAALAMISASVWGEFVIWLGTIFPSPLIRLAAPAGAVEETARVVLVLVVYDFFAYWAHRLQHTLPFFWALHQFHHEDSHMNSTTSLRVHIINVPFVQLFVLVPMMWLLGMDANSLPVYFIVGIFLALSHIDLDIGFGPLTKLLVSPRYHRIHHAQERALHDLNFATLLPLWDILFGTFRAPVKGQKIRTGVAGVVQSTGYWRALVQPVTDWFRLMRGKETRIATNIPS